MRADIALPRALHGWTVLSLRPRGQHAGLRAAAARRGARTLALSPCLITRHHDLPTRQALAQALQAPLVIYTSPNAVAAAAALQALAARPGQQVLAVGSGTRRALFRHGIDAAAPRRMDSEGLLAMPPLAGIAGQALALVTGVGGRGVLVPALQKRGAQVQRVDVYTRQPHALPPARLRALDAVLADPARVMLALSSGEALQQVLACLPAGLRDRLLHAAVSAASPRLADAARAAGFRRVTLAANARPAALLDAAIAAFG